MANFTRGMQNKIYPPPYHLITIFFLLWVHDLYELHHRKACVMGSFKQMEKSHTRSVKSVLGKWLWTLFTVASINWPQRDWWTQLEGSSYHLPFALYMQYKIDLLLLSSEREDFFCTETQDSRCGFLQLHEVTQECKFLLRGTKDHLLYRK